MEKIKIQLGENGFTSDQISEIAEGAQAGVDVSLYADKDFLAIQMRQIRLGLQEGLDVSVYADKAYDWFQMEEIRKGLEEGLQIELYAFPELPYDKMQQIRLGLCDGLDLSPFHHLEAGVLKQLRLALLHRVKIVSFINEGYDTEQLEAIREALEKKVDIVPYLDKRFRGVCIREICLGLEHGLDVSVYAKPCYYWQQMREIRYGMEHMVDVEKYKNPYYSYEQMREIRFGLEEGLDVSYFSSLMYTATDMEKRRLALQEHPGLAVGDINEPSDNDGPELVRIVLAEENTAAYADLCGTVTETLRIEILKALHSRGITYGIRYDAIDRLAAGEEPCMHVLVASGRMPEDGEDGYYEYFFRTHVARTPKTLEDGNVDYRNVEWFEQVKQGQKLACYHGATTGKNGMTVTGKEIPARKGREQSILTGKGFHRLEDGKTYIADLDGIVSLSENYEGTDTALEIRMDVTNLLTVEEVTLATGDVNFDRNVFVRGNVGSGASIYAAGDVLVGGFVEAAHITSGGDIMIRQGMNAASGEGDIRASGDVNGYFFEAVQITAGGSIHGDYFLNCELQAAGRIDVMGKKGSLAGGTACAEQGLRANRLGNQAGLATYVRLGTSERLNRQELNLNEVIRGVTAELDTLNHAHEEFMKKYQPQVRNSMELFLKIESAIYTKEQEMAGWMEKKRKLEEEKRRAAAVSAVVETMLYEGVTFEIERVRWKTTKRLGSVRVKKSEKQIVVYSNR